MRNSRASRLFGSSAVILGIVMLALLLRVLFLGKESLWYDEAYSVDVAGAGGWRYLAGRFWHGDANMSFYYTLLKVWMGVGRTEFVLRALSVIFAVVTIPLIYFLGQRLFGRKTGLLASLLLALNVFHIQYAQEVRSYALLVLLVTLASLLFVSAIQQSSWKPWALYTGAIVLGVYSHFFAALVLVAHWISLTLLARRSVPWRLVMLNACAAGVLLLPLVALVLTNKQDQISWIPRPKPDAILQAFSYLSGTAPVSEVSSGGALFAAAEVARRLLLIIYVMCIGVPLASVGLLPHRTGISSERWPLAFLLSWLLIPLILAYLVSLAIQPVFVYYYLIVSLPPLVLLAANGLSRIQSRASSRVVLLIIGTLAMVQAAAYYDFPRKEDWRGATQYILRRAQPGDNLVFATYTVEAFVYYRDREREMASTAPPIVPISTVLRNGPPRVWLVLSHVDARQSVAVQSSLAIGRIIIDDRRFFNDIRVLLYQARGGP